MTSTDDILALSDFAHERLQHRMVGVTADELDWAPTPDPDLTLR